ncbi:MAG TPA: hypothetical protein VFK05_29150 [Polyangiaceae bacterium]|nr:hypothetical protein [Polyangiaceae bacterium]
MASTFWPRGLGALALTAVSFTGALSLAADPPKERYYFELKAITPKPELKADTVKMATPRVLAELNRALSHHPQIVVRLEGAPDPKLDPDGYRHYLDKSHITDAFTVTVELTDASEVTAPVPDKPGAQEHETRLALRMLGAHIPDDTLGFTGRGKAGAKGEGGKGSERERQETWDQLSELAVSQAIKTALEELTLAAEAKAKARAAKARAAKPKPKPSAAPAPH